METKESPLPETTFDDFLKIDLRAGMILAADRVPKSDKLIRMEVDFGTFKRQILAGVGKTWRPEDLVGLSPLFVVNLAPRKMMGLESHGMLLAAGSDGEPSEGPGSYPTGLALLSPTCPVQPGSKFG